MFLELPGEDLGSLLRRIGRLPADKAAEFARKMCAGLGAAHAKGVLHRDLKPGNIMIDGRGEVRITDFGLATVTEQLQGPEVLHGTPAYMAPEQLAGREATAQSDIYALGLVLYEMFTGKRAHQANSAAELLRMREESPLTSPSSVIADLDPVAERAILRCLQPDPKQRPASALDLARALPGGDPLAAALAAGETPSPEVVAAAGSNEALRPAIAIALLAVFAACLVTLVVLRPKTNVIGALTLDYPPDALAVKAREIAANLGYPERPVDFAWGFTNQTEYVTYLRKSVAGAEAWRKELAAPPSPVTYWYRESPVPIVPTVNNGSVSLRNPVPEAPGMVGMILDMDRRLRQFSAVPPQRVEQAATTPTAPDWSTLFAAARLDMARFKPAEPQWTPLVAPDTRVAWTGAYPRSGGAAGGPGLVDLPIRVEAAAFRGKPVYFQVVWPWTTPDREAAATSGTATVVASAFSALLVAAIVMVRHNLKAGRGDVRGATRVAVFIGSVSLSTDALRAHHVGSLAEIGVLLGMIQDAALASMITWTLYLALEPWVRRYWPQSLIVWSRALGGRWRDPVVGRDILIGMAAGAAIMLGLNLVNLLAIRAGSAPPSFQVSLTNLRLEVADILNGTRGAVLVALVVFLILFFARVLLRNQWLAAVVPAGLLAANSRGALQFTANFVLFGAVAVALMRLGLLVATATVFTALVLLSVRTSNFTAWYGQGPFLSVLVLVAVAVWAFRTSLGGQKLLG